MNRYKYFIIDTNNLFFRNFVESLEEKLNLNLVIPGEKETKEGVVEVFTTTISAVIANFNRLLKEYGYKEDTIIYFVFDNPLSAHQIRKVMSNGKYKHARANKNVPKGVYGTLNIFKHLLQYYSNNFKIVQNEGFEADDLTKPIINLLELDKDNKALCISRDLDWARNLGLNDNVHWLNYDKTQKNKYVIYDKFTFNEKFSYYPNENSIQLFKAFMGDTSDSIEVGLKAKKGEKIERDKLVLYLVNNYDSLEDIFNGMWQDKNVEKKWCLKIQDVARKLLSNYGLVDFFELTESIESMTINSKENIKTLQVWYKSLGLTLESRMMDKKDKEDDFFSVYNYK